MSEKTRHFGFVTLGEIVTSSIDDTTAESLHKFVLNSMLYVLVPHTDAQNWVCGYSVNKHSYAASLFHKPHVSLVVSCVLILVNQVKALD